MFIILSEQLARKSQGRFAGSIGSLTYLLVVVVIAALHDAYCTLFVKSWRPALFTQMRDANDQFQFCC